MLAGTIESMARAVPSDVGCVLGSHVRSGIGKSFSTLGANPNGFPQARGSLDRLSIVKEMET